MSDAPSGYIVERVMSRWMEARDRLLRADPTLEHDEAAMIEALGPEEAERQEVLARLLRSAQHARDMSMAADERAKDIMGRRDRYRRRAEALVGSALGIMLDTGERRVELPELTASIRRNPESVLPVDEAEIPDEYWRVVTTRSLDKDAIKRAIKAGETVPGAMLSQGSESLMIKAT
jgi:hypothetical protein